MELDNFQIKEKINWLYNDLARAAATFIYNPDEIKEIKNQIFELQEKCNHEYVNRKCIYCRKEENNVD